jgi:Tfp pilus assembly protein FimT
MIELVAVLTIAAVLAIVATSLFDRRSFATAAFTDETRAQLAYAQRVAVGTRRTVTVTVSGGNTIALTMCADAACTSTVPVQSPHGEADFTRTAPAGVTIAPDGAFSFDALGGIAATRTLTITGDVARAVTVEGVTGYVR